jgi:hypothetical protein
VGWLGYVPTFMELTYQQMFHPGGMQRDGRLVFGLE